MSVEDWSREQARRLARDEWNALVDVKRDSIVAGITRAFDALLSDEAVEAAAEHFYDEQTGTRGHYPTSMYREKWKGLARAALQAAVRAVTEGEGE